MEAALKAGLRADEIVPHSPNLQKFLAEIYDALGDPITIRWFW